MAFPGTYNISYYKGDTLEFRIYPKDSSGAAFDLSDFSTAKFTIATARGAGATQIIATASISSDSINNLTYVTCAITPAQGATLNPAIQYVYDVEISRTVAGSYPYVYTLVTGTVTVTDQVSGAE